MYKGTTYTWRGRSSLLHVIKGPQDATSRGTIGEGGPNCSLIHKPRDTEFGVVFVTENSAKILNAKASLDFQTLG
jgi:hypothetical protein